MTFSLSKGFTKLFIMRVSLFFLFLFSSYFFAWLLSSQLLEQIEKKLTNNLTLWKYGQGRLVNPLISSSI